MIPKPTQIIIVGALSLREAVAGAKDVGVLDGVGVVDPAGRPVEDVVRRALGDAPDAVVVVANWGWDSRIPRLVSETGLSRARVLGVGTVAETQVFRELIASRCRVAVEEVHAYVAGRSEGPLVPLWSTAAIGAVPLHQWAVPGHGKLTVRDRTEIFQQVRESAAPDPGVAVGAIVDAILHDRNRIMPVASLLNDYHGISGACLGVPCIVNRGGAETPINIALNPAEEAGLREAASTR